MRAFCIGVGIISGLACASASAPAPPATPLHFSEFFVLPVGPKGLEPTATLLELRGARVRVQGYMVEEEEPFPGFFMLASVPVTIAERADGPADLLPPATLFVHLPPAQQDEVMPHQRGLLELSGRLELGAREEASGRFSTVRLLLEELPASLNRNLQGAIE